MTVDPRLAIGVCIASLTLVAVAGIAQPLPAAGLLALVLALTALGVVSPQGSTLAVVVVLPYFYRPLTSGSVSLAASEILLVAAIAGTLGRVAFGIVRGDIRLHDLRGMIASILRSPLVWFLVVIVAAGIVTTIVAYDPAQRGPSLREFRWSLLEPLLLVGLLLVIAQERQIRLLLAMSLVAAGVLAAAHGVLDIGTGSGVMADNVRRLSGPLPHPNALALFLVRPLALAAAIAVLVPQWRKYALLPVGLTGIVLLATFSRGAMMAVVAIAVVLSLFATRRVRVAMFSAVAAMGGFAFIVAGDRMTSALEGGSVSLRIDIWTSALRMVRDNPVSGYGPDQFLYAYAPRYIIPTAWDERFTSHAHNLMFDAWIRLGLIGAVAAVFAVVFVFWSLRPGVHKFARHDWLPTAALVALVATMVHGLIDNAYFGHDLAMSSWLLAWLAFSPPGSRDGEVADAS